MLTPQNRCLNEPLWEAHVTVVPGDMREVSHGNVLADILVSELLGSWGDNELSPECLDGAQSDLQSSPSPSPRPNPHRTPPLPPPPTLTLNRTPNPSPSSSPGAQRYLKPSGISIPCDYTSYVAPLSSPKLWNEVRNFDDLAHYLLPTTC